MLDYDCCYRRQVMGNMKETKKKKQSNSNWVTLGDIATHCNVSKATVSRVLNGRLNEFPVSEAMIERVKTAAEELGYRPNWMARAIRNQKTHLVGLSCFHPIALPSTAEQLTRDSQRLGEYTYCILSHPKFDNYDLVFHKRVEQEGKPLRVGDFQPDLLDGLIYLSPSNDHREFLDMASADFPIVLIGQTEGAKEKVPCIDINNREMGRQAVEHLIGLGRCNILMLIPEIVQHLSCIQDRLQGYRDALTENGIQVSDQRIHITRHLKRDVDGFIRNLACIRELDAIFCATDDLAALCIAPLKAMGLQVPEDIAIMGFGNGAVCQHTTPPLSSVCCSAHKQTYAAIDLLLKVLNKEIPYEPGFHEIEAELVIRESTAGTGQD